LRIPRAGLPDSASVTVVASASAASSESRQVSPMGVSGQPRKAVPNCTADAPRARDATMPRASMMPPAAITGTATAYTICGTRAMVPINACR
jgi:hypothetical protein